MKTVRQIDFLSVNRNITRSFELDKEIDTFIFGISAELLPKLKGKGEIFLMTALFDARYNTPVIVQSDETEEFFFGTIKNDKLTKIDYFQNAADKTAFPLPVKLVTFYGEAVGYCLLNSRRGINERNLHFLAF